MIAPGHSAFKRVAIESDHRKRTLQCQKLIDSPRLVTLFRERALLGEDILPGSDCRH